MKRIILSLILALVGVGMYAQTDFTEGPITYSVTEENTCCVSVCDKNYSGQVVVPSTVSYNGNVYLVKIINSGAFSECVNINSIVVSEGVEYIYRAAFAGCKSLTALTLPSTAKIDFIYSGIYERTILQRSQFTNNSSITSDEALDFIGLCICDEKTDDGLIIKNNTVIGYIGNGPSVTIPNTVTNISSGVFENQRNLTSITIPESLTGLIHDDDYCCYNPVFIERGKCFNYANLSESILNQLGIILCDSRTDDGLIINNHKVESYMGNGGDVSIPEGVTSIATFVFHGGHIFTSLTLPSSLRDIETVTYPVRGITLSYVERDNFKNNSELPDEYINRAFIEVVDEITIDGLIILNHKVIGYIAKGTEVNIPYGVTDIVSGVFYGTAISSIKIPESVTSIGDGAFYGCSRLSNITLQSTTPPNVSSDAFNASTYTSATLYVPYESLEAYKSHEVWGKFKFIVPIGSYLHYYQNCKDESLVGTDYYYFTQDDSEVRMLNDDGHDYGDKHICIYCGKYESIKPDQDSDYIYIIANAHNLIWFRDYINSLTKRTEVHAIQINDIDLSGVCNETKGSWTPIGTASISYWYGSYDGQNHKITGLYINTDQENQGLFGIVGYSDMKVDISNLSVTGNVTSKGKSAILCASIAGNIGNCETHGTLNASSGNVGGILGSYAATGSATYSISDCRNYASISCSSGSNVSGIVSSSKNNFTITRCVNYGNITSAGSAVAGIVARGYGNITYCANLGNITSTTSSQVAGITVNILGDCNINGCWSVNGKIYYRKASSTSTLTLTDSYALSDIGTIEDVKAGKLAYLLSRTKVKGSPWGQTIGKDDYPVLDGPEVYQHHQYCEDVLLDKDEYIYYTNDDSEVRRINSGKHVSENCICKYCGKETHNFVNGECTLCHGHMKCSTPTYDPETGLDCTTAGVEYKISFSTWKATYQTVPDKLTLTIIATKPNYDPSEPLILTLDRLDLNNDGQLTPADYQKLVDSIIGK